MSHVDVVAEIRRGMNDAKCAYDLKTEANFSFSGNGNKIYRADH